MKLRQQATFRYQVARFEEGRRVDVQDQVVAEEPLEVWLEQGRRRRRLGVTMRTPGHDEELSLGLLHAEGVIDAAADVASVTHTPYPGDEQEFNSIRVRLAPGHRVDWEVEPRGRVASSACGICGRETLDDLGLRAEPVQNRLMVESEVLAGLPVALRKKQGLFASTGGLHAAALVDVKGTILLVREDVGRHNAVDKVVGHELLHNRIPSSHLLLVSGRAGFEIVQKAVRAGIELVAAVGAPSSLAVDVARQFGVTLVGFLREDRFNVYAGQGRIRWPEKLVQKRRLGPRKGR